MEIAKRLKASNKDCKLLEFIEMLNQAVVQEQQTKRSIYIVGRHCMSHSDWELGIKVLAAVMPIVKQKHFLRKHIERFQQLEPHIQRIKTGKPLITAALLQQHGIPPGKRMGRLLKEAECIAINENLNEPAPILAKLSQLSFMGRGNMMEPRTLTSLQHPLVKHLVKLRADSTYRHEHQALVLEGLKAHSRIIASCQKLLYTPAYASFASSIAGEKWQVTEAILHKISGMTSPEGIVAEIRMPPFVSLGKAKRVLALDGISDPGNMGTLLRTALALGWEAVYFLPGSCDPFNEKALRAARGAHFKLALAKGTAEHLQQWVTERRSSTTSCRS